jgi:hypothetical protein
VARLRRGVHYLSHLAFLRVVNDRSNGDSQDDVLAMMFTKQLRDGVRRGRVRCSVRIWTRAHVKVGGRYQMDEGSIVVDSIAPIAVSDITYDLARESGFESVEDLLRIARHGRGRNVYLIRFHYLPAGAWDTPKGRPR